MESFTVLTDSAERTRALGERIGSRLSGGETILLFGPLGVGKTILSQGIGAGLGVRGLIQSPSFVLERVHAGRLTLRHLDFYRLTAADVEEAGFFAEPDDSAVAVVEWGENAGEIPEAVLRFRVLFVPGMPDRRRIMIEAASPLWGDRIRDAIREAGLRA